MASTEQIVQAARDLGRLIESHEVAARFHSLGKKLQEDVEAQRLLDDFNRQVLHVARKEAEGTPIEVADKRRLEDLQRQMVHHALLRDFQASQMDYVDLMRRVDAAITGRPENDPRIAGGEVGAVRAGTL